MKKVRNIFIRTFFSVRIYNIIEVELLKNLCCTKSIGSKGE